MSNAIRNIIAAGITLGLSDRDTFVSKVSGLIQEYQDDPAKAEKWAKMVTDYLEEMKDDIRLQRVMEKSNESSGMPVREDFERLTKAIEQLTTELQNRKTT